MTAMTTTILKADIELKASDTLGDSYMIELENGKHRIDVSYDILNERLTTLQIFVETSRRHMGKCFDNWFQALNYYRTPEIKEMITVAATLSLKSVN